MQRYAFEIGKLLVRSEKPISEEDRRRVQKMLKDRGVLLTLDAGLEVIVSLS